VSRLQEISKPQVISATMLRTRTRDVLEEARFAGEHLVVETLGKPMVAIVGIEEYWKLMDRTSMQDHLETEV
jgi:antitoxin (DNA-binding transcriptional repressor) of toxin-antitoxin stability system